MKNKILWLFVVFFFIAIICGFSFFSLKAIKQNVLLGIDDYHNDDPITWQKVKTANYQFAWSKATQSIDFVDPEFITNMLGGMQVGIVMGAYHFASPEKNTAVDEANHFVSVAGPYIKSGFLPPVLDLEDPSDGPELSSKLTSAELTAWVQEWMTTVKQLTGITPVLYTDAFYAGYLGSSLNSYGLWIAAPDGNPLVPPHSTGVWSKWLIKQYSWSGNISGIIGNPREADLNVFNGNSTEFNKFIGNH